MKPSEQVAVAMASLRAGAEYDAAMKRLQARLEVTPEEADYLMQRALENARRQAELRNAWLQILDVLARSLGINWFVDRMDRGLRRFPRFYVWLGRRSS